MSGDGKLDIDPAKLAEASGKAAATLADSTASDLTPPPLSATSQLDAALVLLSTTIETQRVSMDTNDTTWATKQTAALTESPPNLVQQDQQNANNTNEITPKFPTPALAPQSTGKTRTI